MKYTVLTLFPEISDAFFQTSIMAKAINRGIIKYLPVNIRDFAFDKHKSCDDAPYGGGAGMLMLPEPLSLALQSVGAKKKTSPNEIEKNKRIVYLSPSGKIFNQKMAVELSGVDELILICGRYEGIDQRIIDLYVDEEISVGDFVLSSGETAALIIIDATYRLIDNVITSSSLEEESFNDGLLEYPQWTRPEVFDNIKVPDILISGHHENIRLWRLCKKIEKTMKNRPELIEKGLESGVFDDETLSIIEKVLAEEEL